MVTNGFYPIELVEKVREYNEVHTLKFRSSEPISFVPGQYAHVLAPASPPGRENVRHLSIASIPEEGTLQFTVDLAPTSDYKRKLAALAPGGTAHLFKVKGEFVLGDPMPPQAVFVAGGLGITPIRSLIRQIVRHGFGVEWRLLHIARNAFLYQSDLEPLGGIQRRVARSGVDAVLSPWSRELHHARYYVSGSSRFVEGIREVLVQKGIPNESISVEDFH